MNAHVTLSKEDAATTIKHLLKNLAAYICENHRLCDLLDERDRAIERYRTIIRDFERQGAA